MRLLSSVRRIPVTKTQSSRIRERCLHTLDGRIDQRQSRPSQKRISPGSTPGAATDPGRGAGVGWDVDGHLPPDFIAQVRQTLRNIAAILEAGNARPEHLVRLTWYVVDMDEYLASLKALWQIYREVFGTHYPAMALVQVMRLVEKAAKVEIEATAVVPR